MCELSAYIRWSTIIHENIVHWYRGCLVRGEASFSLHETRASDQPELELFTRTPPAPLLVAEADGTGIRRCLIEQQERFDCSNVKRTLCDLIRPW